MSNVAELVDNLFRTHRRADGREYTYVEVAVALQGAVEPSHLSKLRTGRITNPGRETLLSLCRFFKVPPSYFFPELSEFQIAASPSNDAIRFVLRSAGLTPDVEEKLTALIQALQSPKPDNSDTKGTGE